MSPARAKACHVQREPRWACNFAVRITDDNGSELIGRLANISDGGFMAECERKVRLGSMVEVDIPERGIVRAEVRWAVGWRFGAKIVSR
jgi:positive regulator of sigma E activity